MSTKREREKAERDFGNQLAANIYNRRVKLDMSQSDLASLVPGWTQAKVSQWESQYARPGVYNLVLLAKALKTTPGDLLPKV